MIFQHDRTLTNNDSQFLSMRSTWAPAEIGNGDVGYGNLLKQSSQIGYRALML